MGYTHYWRRKRDISDSEWLDIMESAKPLLYETDIPLENIVIDLDHIQFNGLGDDGHETCYVERKYSGHNDDGFRLCKTARKPYDAVVVEFLKMVREKSNGALMLSSNGGDEVFR